LPKEVDCPADPVSFQRSLPGKSPDWQEDMLREEWDGELLNLFKLFCVGRLRSAMDILQRYAKAYAKGSSAGPATPPITPKKRKSDVTTIVPAAVA